MPQMSDRNSLQQPMQCTPHLISRRRRSVSITQQDWSRDSLVKAMRRRKPSERSRERESEGARKRERKKKRGRGRKRREIEGGKELDTPPATQSYDIADQPCSCREFVLHYGSPWKWLTYDLVAANALLRESTPCCSGSAHRRRTC
jgi:hypothetical protein